MTGKQRQTRGVGNRERTSITVLVLGDEGVGKSSLISTYVSRHFSEGVPGIMTRVRLPPEPETPCITTIVDSQGGDAALISAVTSMSVSSPTSSSQSLSSIIGNKGKSTTDASSTSSSMSAIENVDSIILVYDLDRVETFYRLENHWLPLIERCYNGKLPVIVAGNKMDLYRPSSSSGGTSEELTLARSRQQINALLQRFKFVLQWIKCSAKNLLHIDEVFRKAQQAVLYPITPLYDLSTARLTHDCRRALTRIFRIYDRDNDGLLSNDELDAFQCQAFPVRLVERDFAGWKKVVSRNNTSEEPVIRDGKFTVEGFLAIFEVFITQNRLESPWRALRYFGYDDELKLHISPSIVSYENWKLSMSARRFLEATFRQFDSDDDGILSSEDIQAIFSVLPEPSLPPWHPVRAKALFKDCLSIPKLPAQQLDPAGSPGSQHSGRVILPSSLSASGITICSGTSLPSVDVSTDNDDTTFVSSPMSLSDWMCHWHMISAISPSTTRSELYRLGHVPNARRKSKGLRVSKGKVAAAPAAANVSEELKSIELRFLVLGTEGCGKSSMLNALCPVDTSSPMLADSFLETTKTKRPETRSCCVKLRRKEDLGQLEGDRSDVNVFFIFTEIPQGEYVVEGTQVRLSTLLSREVATNKRSFDCVILAFDSTDSSSFVHVKEIETEFLDEEVPRVFVGTKKDALGSVDETVGSSVETTQESKSDEDVEAADASRAHCQEMDLEPPLLISVTDSVLGSNSADAKTERVHALSHLAQCALEDGGIYHLRSTPHAEKKRKEAAWRRKKMMWFGGLVGVGVAVAVGVGVIWGGVAKGGRKGGRLGGWIQQVLGGARASLSTQRFSPAAAS